ncbi:BcepGomrgp11 [Burkholderia phage BcepGomr]|uniref:BcepGomrgp11 n=1 Tax=Burkholderia phage BcepGomr TaxID=437329 RepID=UPI0001503470|nr:BcepGomrgp11 [Burkholderia phage BcepGomr]ABP63582.1 BcepGomrgp11 [Burkholderia phage BcepGomr]
MIQDALQARSDINTMLFDQWSVADWSKVKGGKPNIAWEGRESARPPDGSAPYVAIFIKHVDGQQASLTDPDMLRRWSRDGLITVQCFGMLSAGQGLEDATYQATIAMRAFEGKQSANGIWFRNARIKEIGSDRGWYQVNMIVEFEYDEVR